MQTILDYPEPLNIITDPFYAERVILHVETAEFEPDNSELTLLFIQLQQVIRSSIIMHCILLIFHLIQVFLVH